MPKNNTSGIGVQGTQTTPRTQKRAKRFPIMLRDMRKLPVSDGTMYQVSFSAVVRESYGTETSKLDFTRCYTSIHPLMALGVAMSDLETDYFESAINVGSIRITQP